MKMIFFLGLAVDQQVELKLMQITFVFQTGDVGGVIEEQNEQYLPHH